MSGSWGWMSGLGAGLQQVGSSMMQENAANRKVELLDKLKIEEEGRAEVRQIAREERQMARPSGTRITQTPEGVWMEETLNGAGKPIDSRLAPKNIVDSMTRQEEKDRLSLEKLTTEAEINRRKLSDYDADKARDIAYENARIASTNRANRGNGVGGIEASMTAAGKSKSELATFLADQYPDLRKQYTEGEDAALSASDWQQLAFDSIDMANQQGVDASVVFRKALPSFSAKRRAKMKQDKEPKSKTRNSY